MIFVGLVFSIQDATEMAIQKRLKQVKKMLKVNNQGEELRGMSPPQNRHFEIVPSFEGS
jgi:hypothetical protein